MPAAQALVATILAYIGDSPTPTPSTWNVGITQEPNHWKMQIGEPPYWAAWETDCLNDARAILIYFQKSTRMKARILGALEPKKRTFVYVY